MASSYSTDLKLELMATGENAGTWGDNTNNNLNLIQQAIAGYEAVSIAGGAQTTALAMTDATLSNARNAVIKLTGTITGNQIVTIPDSIEKIYIISNGTSGAFTVEFKTVSGSGITFGTTDKGIRIVYSDGTDIVDTGVLTSVVQDTTPQLGGQLDVNGNAIGNGTEELIKFIETASAVNEVTITNSATGNAPEISATGDDTNIDFKLTPKGSGNVVLDGLKYPNADGSADQFLKTDGSGNLSFGDVSGGISWQSSIKTSAFTAVAGEGYWINTTSGAVTMTLPASASVGDTIEFSDYARTWGTNAVTVNQNSLNFQGYTSPNPKYEVTGQSVRIVYSGATQGWIPTSDDDVEAKNLTSTEYLVVAGGGSGASRHGGGGGAGGFLTNYGGTPIFLSSGTTYTVTVGAGGAGRSNGDGYTGSDSVLSGTGITTITSNGGGGGGRIGAPGNDGGSGGGAGGFQDSPPRDGGTGTVGQGNDGGDVVTTASTAPGYGGAGGGGAGEVGEDVPSGSGDGGDGGDGLENSITGTGTFYAGGGGGSSDNGEGVPGQGLGGNGGGGAGAENTTATSGTANTGGGGGGVYNSSYTSGAGGSGVVILRMPTTKYSGTTTGSPTVTTDGTDTVIKFTASGSYTA